MKSNLTLGVSTHASHNRLWDLSLLSSTTTRSSPTRGALGLVGRLSGLDFLNRRFSLSTPHIRLHSSLLLQIIQAQSHDGPGNLVRPTNPLLGGSLRKSLLVETTPCLGPHELGRLFALLGEGVGFGGSYEYGFSITTDEEGSISRVDPVLGEGAKFSYCGETQKGVLHWVRSCWSGNVVSLLVGFIVLNMSHFDIPNSKSNSEYFQVPMEKYTPVLLMLQNLLHDRRAVIS